MRLLRAPICLFLLSSTLASSLIYVDDQSPYSDLYWNWVGGPWDRFSNYTDSGLAWKGTLTLGNQSGAMAIFTFRGSSVVVYGSLWPHETSETVRSTYSMDGGPSQEFLAPQSGVTAPCRVQLYASGTLPEGEHILNITNLGAFLWLDYVEYDIASADTSNSSLAAATTTPPGTSQPGDPPSPTSPLSFSSEGPPAATVHNTIPLSSSNASESSSTNAPTGRPSSRNTSTPVSQGSATSSPTPHRIPYAAPVGLIVATSASSALLALALFAYLRRRYLNRNRNRNRRLRVSTVPPVHTPVPTPGSAGDPFADASGDDACHGLPAPVYPCRTVTTPATVPRIQEVPYPVPHSGDGHGDGDVVRSCDCGMRQAAWREHHQATDGGVSIAGGPGLSGSHGSNGDAPSISVSGEESEKSMLPPPYQD